MRKFIKRCTASALALVMCLGLLTGAASALEGGVFFDAPGSVSVYDLPGGYNVEDLLAKFPSKLSLKIAVQDIHGDVRLVGGNESVLTGDDLYSLSVSEDGDKLMRLGLFSEDGKIYRYICPTSLMVGSENYTYVGSYRLDGEDDKFVPMYAVDNWDVDGREFGGDGIPDDQQVLIRYNMDGDVEGTLGTAVQVFTVPDSAGNLAGGFVKPTGSAVSGDGAVFLRWTLRNQAGKTVKTLETASLSDLNETLYVEPGEIYTYTATFMKDAMGSWDGKVMKGDGYPDAWQAFVCYESSMQGAIELDGRLYVADSSSGALSRAYKAYNLGEGVTSGHIKTAEATAQLFTSGVYDVGWFGPDGFVQDGYHLLPMELDVEGGKTYTYKAVWATSSPGLVTVKIVKDTDFDDVIETMTVYDFPLLSDYDFDFNDAGSQIVITDMGNQIAAIDRLVEDADGAAYAYDSGSLVASARGDVTVTLVYSVDENADAVPDKYQAFVRYEATEGGSTVVNDAEGGVVYGDTVVYNLSDYRQDVYGKYHIEAPGAAAVTDDGHMFIGWSCPDRASMVGDRVMSGESLTVAPGEHVTYTAVFKKDSNGAISSGGNVIGDGVPDENQIFVTFSADEGGKVKFGDQMGTTFVDVHNAYAPNGDPVRSVFANKASAVADEGYLFSHWDVAMNGGVTRVTEAELKELLLSNVEAGGNYVIIARFDEDKLSDKDYDEDESVIGDGVPDKYQVVITYNAGEHGQAVTGTSVLTKLDRYGNFALNGVARMTEANLPVIKADNGWKIDAWSPSEISVGMVFTTDAAFDVSFKSAGRDVIVFDPNSPDTPGNTPVNPDDSNGDGDIDITDPDTPLAPGPGANEDENKSELSAKLDTTEHFAYVHGYPDGTVRPGQNISRAEVATIFYRLMQDEYRTENWASLNSFPDVFSADWYNTAVSTAASAGLVKGDNNGAFRPTANITRAEFVTIAARIAGGDASKSSGLSDVNGHWAEAYINRAVELGWIYGYPDNTFRPDAYITRAEAIVIINRMLGRTPDADHMLSGMNRWPDNSTADWYYADVQEATNGHDFVRDDKAGADSAETWIVLTVDRNWTALEAEWAKAATA